MVELHVDSCEGFIVEALTNTEFGGWGSVRLPEDERQLLLLGQDESS